VSSLQSKSDALFTRLRDDILSLALAPDTPLRLPALSERYGAGLTPLRDCLTRLATDRLVHLEHNKGFRVGPLTRVDLLDLERSRNAIEGAMFVQSLQEADDDWEAGVVGAWHHLSRTPVPSVMQEAPALALWTRRHGAFHGALIGSARSPWMRRFAGQIEDQLGRYHLFIQAGLRDLSATAPEVAARATEVFATAMALEPHRALFDAALSRDGAAARTAFDAHGRLSITAFEHLTDLMPAHTPFATTLGPRTEAVP
jgi:GntR family carbon starvation induced transcriptional regulator